MTLPERSPRADYIGDGVYVDIDEYGDVILTTEDGISVQNRVVLEPAVLGAFQRYLTCWEWHFKMEREAHETEASQAEKGDPE